MKQVIKGAKKSFVSKKNKIKNKVKPEYGTSKLEVYFAKNFLDKLGVEYVYQYEAKDIKRFYDFFFFLPNDNLIIEVDGDYFHSFGLTYEQMCPMQKRNKRVDELKDKWALMHGIPILRFWEHDINDNPEFVLKKLKEMIQTQEKHRLMIEKKKKPH